MRPSLLAACLVLIGWVMAGLLFPRMPLTRPVSSALAGLGMPLVLLCLSLALFSLLGLILVQRRRRTGLLSACLMLSVMLHLLGFSMLNLWALRTPGPERTPVRERHVVSLGLPSLAESTAGEAIRRLPIPLSKPDQESVEMPRVPERTETPLPSVQTAPASEVEPIRPLPPEPTRAEAIQPQPRAVERMTLPDQLAPPDALHPTPAVPVQAVVVQAPSQRMRTEELPLEVAPDRAATPAPLSSRRVEPGPVPFPDRSAPEDSSPLPRVASSGRATVDGVPAPQESETVDRILPALVHPLRPASPPSDASVREPDPIVTPSRPESAPPDSPLAARAPRSGPETVRDSISDVALPETSVETPSPRAVLPTERRMGMAVPVSPGREETVPIAATVQPELRAAQPTPAEQAPTDATVLAPPRRSAALKEVEQPMRPRAPEQATAERETGNLAVMSPGMVKPKGLSLEEPAAEPMEVAWAPVPVAAAVRRTHPQPSPSATAERAVSPSDAEGVSLPRAESGTEIETAAATVRPTGLRAGGPVQSQGPDAASLVEGSVDPVAARAGRAPLVETTLVGAERRWVENGPVVQLTVPSAPLEKGPSPRSNLQASTGGDERPLAPGRPAVRSEAPAVPMPGGPTMPAVAVGAGPPSSVASMIGEASGNVFESYGRPGAKAVHAAEVSAAAVGMSQTPDRVAAGGPSGLPRQAHGPDASARTGPESPGADVAAAPVKIESPAPDPAAAPAAAPRLSAGRGSASTPVTAASLVGETEGIPGFQPSALDAHAERVAAAPLSRAVDWVALAVAAPAAEVRLASGTPAASPGSSSPSLTLSRKAGLPAPSEPLRGTADGVPKEGGSSEGGQTPSLADEEYSLSLGPPRRPAPAAPATPALSDPGRPSLLSVGTAPAPGTVPEKAIYEMRKPSRRRQFIRELGGTPETENAVEAALAWLSRSQSGDGRWDIDGFPGVEICGGAGDQVDEDVAVTGLALLAFLGAGYTHLDGPYQETVRRGLEWLVGMQREDGDLRGPGQMYSQAIGSAALCEAYSMTGDERLRAAAERAVSFIVAAQTPEAGWRYVPGKDSDTSVTGWQILALKSAQIAGLAVPDRTFRWTAAWLDKVRSGREGGFYAYKPQHVVTPVMTAEGWFCQMFMDEQSRTRGQVESARYVAMNPPAWNPAEGAVHLYYWYYATLSLYLSGAKEFAAWNEALQKALLAGHVKTGPAAGSWDPVCRLGPRGGRIYSTATAALCLEVYYRYLPFYRQAGR